MNNLTTGLFTRYHLSPISRVGAVGAIMSILASLSVGVINLKVLQLTAIGRLIDAWALVAGALLVEVIFIALVLHLLANHVVKSTWLVLAYCVRFAFPPGMLFAQLKSILKDALVIPEYSRKSISRSLFVEGVLLNASKPLPFTFCAGRTAINRANDALADFANNSLGYIMGILFGTLLSHLHFSLLGAYLSPKLENFSMVDNVALTAGHHFVAINTSTKALRLHAHHAKTLSPKTD